MLFEKRPGRRIEVDVDGGEFDVGFLEIAPGVAAGGARRLGVKGQFGHGSRIMENAERRT
jgi:hypothetical protein